MELYALQPDFAVLYLEAIENASAEDRAAAIDKFGGESLPEIVSRNDDNNEAAITITGIMSPSGPSPIARFFGFSGTGYNDIVAAAKALEDDTTIDIVRLKMDTPGGTVAGMDQARQALESLASKKTLIAENHGRISSAGYYLATAAGKIQAMSPLAITGSIGVITAGIDTSEAMARNGIKRIRIVSSNAPDKQPDPTTSHGRGVIQDGIDAMERIFIRAVADGRGTTDQNVIDNFGKGAEFVAIDPDPEKPDALKAGMIDSVMTQSGPVVISDADEIDDDITAGNSDTDTVTSLKDTADPGAIGGGDNIKPETQTAASGVQQEGTIMDLNKLKAEHPDLYAQAVSVGVTQERERASAHINMGKAAGDIDLAIACIEDGSELTASVNSKYLASQMNKAAAIARGDESVDDIDAEGADVESEHDKALAKAVAEDLGVESDA